MILGIAGSRPQWFGHGRKDKKEHKRIKASISDRIVSFDPDVLITTMMPGPGLWAAEIAHQNKVPFKAIIPYSSHDQRWEPVVRQKYQYLIGKAEQVIEVDRQKGYISRWTSPGLYGTGKFSNQMKYLARSVGLEDTFIIVASPIQFDPLMLMLSEALFGQKGLSNLYHLSVTSYSIALNRLGKPLMEDLPF